MSATDVLEKTSIGFETSIKNGIIELPVEYRNTAENFERAFAYGNSLAKKYGFTEEDLNNEIEMYRKEKTSDENSY